MSVPAVPAGTPGVPAGTPAVPHDRGRRVAIRSLLMLPMFMLTMIVVDIVSQALLRWRDIDPFAGMSEQGGYGWVVWAVGIVVLMIPPALGVVLGVRARRLGARGMALAGILLNGVLLVGFPIVALIGNLGM